MRRIHSGCGWSVGLAVTLAVTACRPAQSSTPELVAATGALPRPGPHRARDAVVVAVASSPLQLLPDTTVAVGSVAGVQALLAVLDVEALITKYRGYYDQAAALIVGSAGFNLLDPAQWREVGIDPDGLMGVAALDIRSETYVGFITLADPGKFRAFLDKVGGERRMRPVLEDRGVVLKQEADSHTALVLRDGFAFLVSTARPNDAPYDFSRLLATIDPARGLTTTPRYQRAIASPEPVRPLLAYVDLWAIVQAEQISREVQAREAEPSWAEMELARAVETGASAQEQARLRRQVDELRTFQRNFDARREREMALLKRWLAPVEPVVFEFTASRTGVVGKVRAKMPESAPLRAVLRNAATPSPVLGALGERPVFQLGGSVDVAALVAAFEEMVRVDGDEPARFYARLQTLAKVDFKAEVVPLLAGSAGFAVTASDTFLRAEPRSNAKDFGFALGLAVKDVPAARALVARAVASIPVKVGKDARTGAFTLVMPDYRTVYVAVVAEHIVVTTDAGVIRRLGAGTDKQGRVPAVVVPVLTARDVAFQGMFDLVLPMVALGVRSNYEMDAPSFEPYGSFPDVTPEQIDEVPRSRAYKAKLRAWQAVHAKVRKEEMIAERRQTQMVLAFAECFGILEGNLREHPDGLELASGQYFGKGGVTRAVELGMDQFTPARNVDRNWDLYNERSALGDELRTIRMIDVSTALGVARPLQ